MRALRVAPVVVAVLLGGALAWWSTASSLRDGGVPSADISRVSHSIEFFEGRLAADPQNYLVLQKLIDRYVHRFALAADLMDVARADALARELVKRGPDTVTALSRQATILLMQHRFAEAFVAASHAVAYDSTDLDALGAMYDAALAGGNYGAAEWALERLPGNALETLVRRAYWAEGMGDGATASRSFGRVCRQLERSARPQHVRAWCLVELGGLEHGHFGARAARARYREALMVLPGYRAAIEGLADLAQAEGRWSDALRLYQQIAVEAHPDLYLRLAEVYRAIGDSGSAGRATERFLDVAGRPEHEPLYGVPLISYLTTQGTEASLDRAYALARRETERRPTMASFDTLGWVLFLQGRHREALVASNASRTWGAPSATMNYHRALILEANDREAEALALYAAATADPGRLEPEARWHFHSNPRLRQGGERT